MKKVCKKCNIEKPVKEFFIRKASKDGFLNHCIKCDRIYKKNYKATNKERIDKEHKKFRDKPENKAKKNLSAKTYYQQNKKRIAKRNRERRKNNPLYKLSHYMRSMIRDSFRNQGYSKTSKTQNILGCSFEQFKTHLEGEFKDWMNWRNYGLYNGQLNYGWDIDHIIPLCSAKNEGELIKLNHYTNLHPLCSKINRDIKRGNI